MDVRFYTTTSSKLPSLSISNGQLIYLSDIDAGYYDMGGSRRPLSGMRLVQTLPQTGQPDIIYVVIDDSTGYANASIWDSSNSEYVPISGQIATVNQLGLVKPDGTTITITSDGTISCHAEVTSLPASSITYVNTTSGYASTAVQGALDEAAGVAASALANAASAAGAATAAQSTADSAQSTADSAAANASTALVQIAALTSRIEALEAVAAKALVTED